MRGQQTSNCRAGEGRSSPKTADFFFETLEATPRPPHTEGHGENAQAMQRSVKPEVDLFVLLKGRKPGKASKIKLAIFAATHHACDPPKYTPGIIFRPESRPEGVLFGGVYSCPNFSNSSKFHRPNQNNTQNPPFGH